MLVKDLLDGNHRKILTIATTNTVFEAMKLLIQNKISCLPVVDKDDALVGIVSDKDIFRLAYQRRTDFPEHKIEQVMSTNLIVGLPEDELSYIATIMTENKIRHIPIVDGRNLAGLVSLGDIVKNQLSDISAENRYLKEYIHGHFPT